MVYLKKIVSLLSVVLLLLPALVAAELPTPAEATNKQQVVLQQYRYVGDVPSVSVTVPTTVEVILSGAASRSDSPLVYEKGSDRLIRATLQQPQSANLKPSISISRNSGTRTSSLTDDDENTFFVLEAYPNGVQEGDTWISTITVSFGQSVTASEAVLAINTEAGAPAQVSVLANGNTVVPWQEYAGEQISFGRDVHAAQFQIRIEHNNDLKITEVDVPYTVDSQKRLRFLMQPSEQYQIYTDPTVEAPRNRLTQIRYFNASEEARFVGTVIPVENDLYWQADQDGDGFTTANDNCPEYANADQADLNQNDIGDACEDFDGDRVVAALDNCPDRPNPGQRDTDADGIGDECDPTESRLTEQYEWVPFVGIVVAALVLILLFVSVSRTAKKMSLDSEEEGNEEPSQEAQD